MSKAKAKEAAVEAPAPAPSAQYERKLYPPRVVRRSLTWFVVADGKEVSSHETPEEAAEALAALGA
jgi:hypothetical protein